MEAVGQLRAGVMKNQERKIENYDFKTELEEMDID